MEQDSLADLVAASQDGSEESRDILLRQLQRLARAEASQVCKQPVTESDDAFSIALLALNEAINTYDASKGARFTGFARIVIRRRVIDHLRSEDRPLHLSLQAGNDEDELASSDVLELDEARLRHEMEMRRLQLAQEIAEYEADLRRFDLDLERLVEATPTHADTRARVYSIARTLASDETLWQEAHTTGRMPLTTLKQRTGASRKVLETWRRYILGLALAMSGRFPGMEEHLGQLDVREG